MDRKRIPYAKIVERVEKVRQQFFDMADKVHLSDSSLGRLLCVTPQYIWQLRRGKSPGVLVFLLMEDCLDLFEEAMKAGILPVEGVTKTDQELAVEKLL